ncbi:MAG: hypothetical protein IJ528_02245 [Bacteroidaceae bacterium]|nr:hypothetical protein [Bacteroidaceae bacterium]
MLAYVADAGRAVAAEYEGEDFAYEGVVQWTCGCVFVAFGSPQCFRMSYATSDENIIEAMRRIKETLARLK